MDKLKSDSSLTALADYFDRARDPSANAWVLNVLLCMPEASGGDAGGNGRKEPLPLSVSPHVDETLGTSSTDFFMAHVVRQRVCALCGRGWVDARKSRQTFSGRNPSPCCS